MSSDMFTAARTAIPRSVCSASCNLLSREWRIIISRKSEPLKRLSRYVGFRASESSRSRCDEVPVMAKMIRAVRRSLSSCAQTSSE